MPDTRVCITFIGVFVRVHTSVYRPIVHSVCMYIRAYNYVTEARTSTLSLHRTIAEFIMTFQGYPRSLIFKARIGVIWSCRVSEYANTIHPPIFRLKFQGVPFGVDP